MRVDGKLINRSINIEDEPMKTVAMILVVLVALLHAGFLVLEMFLWDHEIGRNVFNMSVEQSQYTAQLAMNQGLYNGFLSAGLLWGVFAQKRDVIVFFLLCVIVAGVFGALSVKISILFIQALPAILALLALTISNKHA